MTTLVTTTTASIASQLKRNTYVSFRTKNSFDTVSWYGKVVGVDVSSEIAEKYSDIQTVHEQVKKTDPSIPDDYRTLNYFLIQVNNTKNDEIIQTFAFSDSWVDATSFKIESNYIECLIRCYLRPGNTPSSVVSLLKSADITSEVVS